MQRRAAHFVKGDNKKRIQCYANDMPSRMAEPRSAPPIPDVQDCPRRRWKSGDVYMRKLAPARVSYRDDFFISVRVYIMTGSFHISLFEGTLHVEIQNHKHYACTTRSSQPADWFHTETCGHFAFTWCRCEISYRSAILAPVQQPGWTHTWVTRTGMTFSGGIM